MEKIMTWLQTFPGWGGKVLRLDLLPEKPDSAGLYPKGMQVLECHEDLLGNMRCRYALRLELLVSVCDGGSEWLWQLQQWVAQQSFLGLAPRLGDVERSESIRAEKACLKERTAAGTAIYSVTLTAEFEKLFEQ